MRHTIIATVTAASCSLLFGACATAPQDEPPPGGQAQQSSPTTPGARAEPLARKPVAGVDVAAEKGADTLKSRSSMPSMGEIYFDYDKFDISGESRPIVEAHAKYLRERPGARVLIQGHADERGSREYNLGLGQRRADSVKNMLVLLGATAAHIESVSLGEEKPACTGHTESCWSQNRRAGVRYAGEH